MAAAYASLVSLSNVLHQILNPPPTHHFNIPTEQIQHLQNQVCSIIDFLENYPNRRIQEIEDLEKRIVGAVHKAEDLIESNVVRQILAKKSSAPYRLLVDIGKFLPIQRVLKKNILKVIKKLASIHRELDEIEDKNGVGNVRRNTTGASSSRSLPGGKSIMVGFDEHLNQMRHVLTSDESTLLIIPVVGMGGIGKTTLAANVYKDPCIIQRFDTRAWVSVSLEYKERDILIALLQQINSKIEGNEFSDDELQLRLHQELFGRRYLIVLDDMWDIQAWDNLNRFLPNDSNGSRILVTTRQQELATEFRSCKPYNISLLDEENSWKLINEYVVFPIEFEKIGRSIARGCGGLPLALAVIGGLLAKSEKTIDFWKHIEKNVTSHAKDANDKHCIKILRLSYSELPIHLKPCFLYLAVFPKNIEMRRSRLIRLWVAEGFIKPTGGNSLLEEVAEGYLKDLCDRNLVMIYKRGIIGQVKNCSIHDLIRVLCMEEARKNEFLWIEKLNASNNSPRLESVRRLSIDAGTETEKRGELREGKHNRSFLNYSAREWRRCVTGKLNLLRVLDVVNSYSMDEIMWLVNSRYITCGIPQEFHASSLISLPWHLQTLVFPSPISLPSEFWQMPQLRHLKMPEITLADPPDDDNVVELKNLQTLSIVKDFILSMNVVRRIPNLKKLGIDCGTTKIIGSLCLSNLSFLLKLESLVLKCRGTWENMAFPDSLKKLTLSCCQIPWEDLSVVGSLPNLEVLKLRMCAAKGQTWKPNAGEFCQLKFLLIEWCQLEIWEADESNFPSLEHLQLERVTMEKFPMDFAYIETLRTINLRYCSKSLLLSANEMSRDRENSACEAIQIQSFPIETQLSREDKVVGFADQEATLIKYLKEETKELDVISIVGIPGQGKTTLAWKIFRDANTEYEFPTKIWVYVSQEFNLRDVFLAILKKFTQTDMSSRNVDELAREVQSRLEKGRFLLFLDDVWTVEDWRQIADALPKNNKFGKVMITSRHEKVAERANPKRDPHQLRFLTPNESWELLQLEVFDKNNGCPPEVEGLGEQIANACRGVPLAVVVIGGILAENCADKKELWEKVSHSMNVYKYCADGKELLENIISLSYSRLPHDMRDCFLYLGIFPEDTEIPAWKLTRLWIAEEFIQQNQGRSLEEVAEDNLNHLVARNLVMVQKTKASGGIKTCRVHDMIREFCQNEAAKKNMFQEVKMWQWVFDPTIPRLRFHSNVMDFLSQKIPKGRNKVRSLLCFSKEAINLPIKHFSSMLEAFELLRVIDTSPIKFTEFPLKLTRLVHLRYVTLSGNHFKFLPEAVSKLWNLQTISIDTMAHEFEIRADIGKMKELRHLKTKATTVLKEVGGEVGENLQTLSRLSAKCCTKELFNRASNLKNLGIRGDLATIVDANFLEILERLEKLDLIHDTYPELTSPRPMSGLPPPESFPPNLRILTLSSTYLDWMHMTTLGSLPNLEVLKLKEMAFRGSRWEVEDSGFRCLESLHIVCTDLEIWTIASDDQPFPKLKNLVLKYCEKLQQIPSQLGNSLQLVELERVTYQLFESARRIEAEKHEMQGASGGKRGGFKLIFSRYQLQASAKPN